MDIEKKIRIGVMGCAGIAHRSVIPAILQLNELFSLNAVASRDNSKAKHFANEFNCRAITGYDSLINSPDIDAIYIPLPTGLHKEWINKALNAGKHVYAEKSIASCCSDTKEMILNARNNCLALMEGFMFQYHSQHQVVFDLINADKIGDIRYFHSSFGFPPLPNSDFRYIESIGGGALLDAAGYPLRAAHFILGNNLEVKGAALHIDTNVMTNIWGSAFLSNNDGLGASIAFGFDNYYQCRYEIWGAKGKIVADRAFTPRPDFSPQIILETTGGSEVIQAKPDNHFVKALIEFHRIICNQSSRQKHYEDILLQSYSLETIRNLANTVKIH